MLDAAEEVILREGIGHLTLHAVASEAKLSKSGLLHHFKGKDALIEALVERKIAAWEAQTTQAIEAQLAGPGRVPRAILGGCLASTRKWTEAQRRSSQVLVAALVHDPKHIEPLRRAHRAIHARIERDGLPAGVGLAVHLAVNGLWFDWIFGISEWTPPRVAAVRGALQQLVDDSIRRQAGSRPGSGPTARPRRAGSRRQAGRRGEKGIRTS